MAFICTWIHTHSAPDARSARAAKTHWNDPLFLRTVPLNTFLSRTHLERVMLVSTARDPESPGRASLQGNFPPGHGYLASHSLRVTATPREQVYFLWVIASRDRWSVVTLSGSLPCQGPDPSFKGYAISSSFD
jgi:hypothetical protein